MSAGAFSSSFWSALDGQSLNRGALQAMLVLQNQDSTWRGDSKHFSMKYFRS
jgi:hypothetical protein